MKFLKLFVVALLLASCSSSKVVYDYDSKTDFSKYKTYAFFEDVGDGLNELDVKRFVSAVEKNLDSLGFQKAENPDFYINVISEKSEIPKNNSVGVGVGSGGRNSGISISTGVFFGGNKINEKITIDFVASSSNKLFWQGFLHAKVKEKIKPEERILWVNGVVNKILRKYPPKK